MPQNSYTQGEAFQASISSLQERLAVTFCQLTPTGQSRHENRSLGVGPLVHAGQLRGKDSAYTPASDPEPGQPFTQSLRFIVDNEDRGIDQP